MLNFEIENIDRLGARAAVIKEKNLGTIEFPQRSITSNDIWHANKAMELDEKLNIKFPGQVYGVTPSYSKERLFGLQSNKKFLGAEITRIKSQRNKMESNFKFFSPRIAHDIIISSKLNRSILNLQLKSDFNVIGIWDSPNISSKLLQKRIETSLSEIEAYSEQQKQNKKRVVIVNISMAQKIPILRKKALLASESVGAIGFKYVPPENYVSRYNAIKQCLKRSPAFVHIYDVPKTWGGNGKTSLIHLLQFYGFDLFSLKPGNRFDPTELTSIPEVKRFDIHTAAYLKVPVEHREIYGDRTACSSNCPIDKGKTLSTILDDFSPEERSTAFRVHEVFDSQMEFAIDRNHIKEGENKLLEHYKGRRFAIQPIHELLGINLNQPLI